MAEPLSASVPINPAGGVDQRPQPNPSATAVAPRHEGSQGPPASAAPSTEFHLGTTVEAVLRAPGATGTLPAGTRFILRIVAVPALPESELLIGRIIDSGGPETLVATPLGLLAVLRRLALAAGTTIAFERLEEIPPDHVVDDTPSRAGGWPALDEALRVLAQTTPALAAALRSGLTALSGAHLTGTLIFLLAALYEDAWPGDAIGTALNAADQAKLTQRLADDIDELRRLAADPATGDWRVLTLPLLNGIAVQPLRLFTRRAKPGTPAEDGATRFAIEVELSRFGPLQLDGLFRGHHLILVLRSHRSLPEDLRQQAGEVYRRALARWDLTGDLSFAAVAEFPLAPLSNLRKHVQISV